MTNRPVKYKICYQNRINLWEQKKLYNFKHKKWLWLSSKKKKTLFEDPEMTPQNITKCNHV